MQECIHQLVPSGTFQILCKFFNVRFLLVVKDINIETNTGTT
jgi:hypothetical protein